MTTHADGDEVETKQTEYSRDRVVQLIADLQKISTPEGIQVLRRLEIGGVKQWLSIRGLHRDNPVILFIHGGPGSPSMPMTWTFQKPWEDFFTVAHWDQRGTGKNWAQSNTEILGPTLTLDRLIEDAREILAYLRRTLRKEKIVVMGWSYGSTIGVELVKRCPDWVSVYVGIGQTTPRGASERYIYRQLIEMADRRSATTALAELQSIAPYPNLEVTNDVDHTQIVRKWVREFGCGWYGNRDMKLFFSIPMLSAEYSSEDATTVETSTMWFLNQIADNGGLSVRDQLEERPEVFRVPVVLMMGRYDLQTPYTMAKDYFERLQAPVRRFVTFERGGHFPMLEQPGKFLKSLLDEVLPLTEGAAPFEELQDAPTV